jgi:Reverse transcriptase (RNA-dependent DNA polymerase)
MAMKKEMELLGNNDVYNTVGPPQDCRTLRTQWVQCRKMNNENKEIKYKSLFLALGNEQQYCIDYEKPFALTLTKSSLRLLSSLAAFYDLSLLQVNINTAHLNRQDRCADVRRASRLHI